MSDEKIKRLERAIERAQFLTDGTVRAGRTTELERYALRQIIFGCLLSPLYDMKALAQMLTVAYETEFTAEDVAEVCSGIRAQRAASEIDFEPASEKQIREDAYERIARAASNSSNVSFDVTLDEQRIVEDARQVAEQQPLDDCPHMLTGAWDCAATRHYPRGVRSCSCSCHQTQPAHDLGKADVCGCLFSDAWRCARNLHMNGSISCSCRCHAHTDDTESETVQ
jgi:hypothetical protein